MNFVRKIFKFSKESAVCKAADISLRFGIGGRVSVCCHNHIDIVGNIQNSTIDEIWNGKQIKKLRKTLKYKYSKGCSHCIAENLIESPTKSSELYERYEIETKHPLILDFKIDNNCNLKCEMCSHLSSNQFLKKDNKNENPYYREEFFEDLKKHLIKAKECRFSGGEPFLIDLYYKIWEFLHHNNPQCKIFVQTNGTILNQRVKDIIERGNFNINISIDSLQKANYEKIREGSNFEKTMSNIDFFRNYCKQKNTIFSITACAMKSSRDEIFTMAEKWSKLGIALWYSVVWNPANKALWSLRTEDFNLFYNKLLSDFEAKKEYLTKENLHSLKTFINVLDYMKDLNFIYNEPKKLINSEEFKALLLSKFIGIKESDSNKNQFSNFLEYFEKNKNFDFNGELFEKTSIFTSNEIISDLTKHLSLNDLEEIVDIYKLIKA